jgi:hypothetical protein
MEGSGIVVTSIRDASGPHIAVMPTVLIDMPPTALLRFASWPWAARVCDQCFGSSNPNRLLLERRRRTRSNTMRTPIIAALRFLEGEQVPGEWVLPQPKVTQDDVQDFIKQDMPPLHYAMCGCESMPGYPGPWK